MDESGPDPLRELVDVQHQIGEMLRALETAVYEINAMIKELVRAWKGQIDHLGWPKDCSIELLTAIATIVEWWDEHQEGPHDALVG